MRGKAEHQETMQSIVTPELLALNDHSIRHVKPIVEQALAEMPPTFEQMDAETGRPSIPPKPR